MVRLTFDSSEYANITVRVVSVDRKQATELFAELEEQIDRTIVTSWIVRYLKSSWGSIVALLSAAVCVLVAGALVARGPGGRVSATESEELQRLLSSAQTDPEKIDALVRVKSRELKALHSPPPGPINWSGILSLRGAFIALPVVVLAGTLIYLIAVCYPWAVFAWGDWDEHYNSLLSRRKMLGGVIVAALFIGVMANLFVASIPPLR